jgi:hypothetical protein
MRVKNTHEFCNCIHFVQERSFVLKMVSVEPVFVKVGLRGPGIDSEESIPSVWESIPGLLKRFTNTDSG